MWADGRAGVSGASAGFSLRLILDDETGCGVRFVA